jgi:hypothetical protein
MGAFPLLSAQTALMNSGDQLRDRYFEIFRVAVAGYDTLSSYQITRL